MEPIKWMLTEHYKLNLHAITPARGGWSADAYIAQTAERAYFVKVYNKRRVSVQPWIDRMDLYLPVVLWLYHNTPLRDRMTAPIRTANQRYKAENEHCVLLVFPMLDGVTLGDTPMSPGQARQLAELLAQLHTYGGCIPVSTRAIREDYSLSFLQELAALLQTGQAPATLQTVLDLHADKLLKAIEILQQLAAALQKNRPCEVLCHTDLHGWNVMWTNKLVLVDWEGLRLAPAEADLFTFTDGFFFDYAQKEGMSAYQNIRKDYTQNKTAMQFYRLRRRLEDIAEFAYSLANDGLSPLDRASALQHLEQECSALYTMLQ